MLCCSTSVGMPILTNCLDWRRRVWSARFLRWGHAEPLSESLVASPTLRLETSLQRGAVHKSQGRRNVVPSALASLTWLVRLLDLFQQRL